MLLIAFGIFMLLLMLAILWATLWDVIKWIFKLPKDEVIWEMYNRDFFTLEQALKYLEEVSHEKEHHDMG